MALRFPSSWIDELYARADIVQLVNNYLPLKKKGHNYWGLCPFHNEKTPSFSVNQELNVYYCFGCKAGGNIAQFVMEMERLTYPEALEYIAKLVNMPLPQTMVPKEDEDLQSLKERIYQANEAAARYYHELLWTPEGAKVLEYLRKRKMDDNTIRKFGLGASGQEWDRLSQVLQQQGFSLEELQKAGLIAVKEKHHYDMFRDRVMFPIINVYGKVLGFGGRALGDAQPKYLNTADTPVFNKRYGVYAANLLRNQRNLKRVLLVEGYMDVIALVQQGLQGVVATLGTALTNEQARFLKRFAPEVWVAYDGDEAGQMAIERAVEIFRQESIPVKVLQFPEGMDPDDMINQHGVEAFSKLRPISDVSFTLRRLEKKLDISSQDGRTEYAKQAAKILAEVPDPVELDLYVKELSLRSGFSREVLLAQMQVAGSRILVTKKKESERKAVRSRPRVLTDEGNAAEQTLLSLLASGKLPVDFVKSGDFLTDTYQTIAARLLLGEQPVKIMTTIEDEATRSLVGKLFTQEVIGDPANAMAAAEECLNTLRKQRINAEIDILKKNMETQNAEQKVETLKEIMRLTVELSGIQRAQAKRKEV